ncbi:MAG: hypothetical protein WC583_02825 [Candidatus Omnitrophota bacterium]|jgi:hypothetical protein|nr:hypothetical protein [Sphaerochaeta sp.]
MLSTNTTQPKADKANDKFLELIHADDGEHIGYISHIPRRLITSDDKKAKPREAFTLPTRFPGVIVREQKAEHPSMLQASDLKPRAKPSAKGAAPFAAIKAAPDPAPKSKRRAKRKARVKAKSKE